MKYEEGQQKQISSAQDEYFSLLTEAQVLTA